MIALTVVMLEVEVVASFVSAPIVRLLVKTNIEGIPLIENSFYTQSMQVVVDAA